MSDWDPGGKTKEWGSLTDIEVVSGSAEDPGPNYRGFVTVRATAEDGSYMAGQLSPTGLRKMAMNFIGAAEAAEQDAVVITLLTKEIGLDAAQGAHLILKMRRIRHLLYPDPDDR